MSNTISPVGIYNPANRVQPAQVQPPLPPIDVVTPPGGAPQGNGFLRDVWVGGRDQLKDYGDAVTHPGSTLKNGWESLKHPGQLLKDLTQPYLDAINCGHPGQAVGRLLAHVAVIGGAILGGRALLGGGGGARVGTGVVGDLVGGVGRAIGSVVRGVGAVVSAPFRLIGNLFRGGAHVGFR